MDPYDQDFFFIQAVVALGCADTTLQAAAMLTQATLEIGS